MLSPNKLFTSFLLITTTVVTEADNAQRLNRDFDVSHYELEINILNITSDTFNGQVKIFAMRRNKQGTKLKLHAASDFITTVKAIIIWPNVTCVDESVFLKNSNICTYTHEKDIMEITSEHFKENINHTITIKYVSKLSTTDMDGVYRSSYQLNGNTEYLIATQFEPTYARRAFPCIDEPQFKATFDISITRPKGYQVLSNMPKMKTLSRHLEDAKITFERTPKMSTYLVAFLVSKFDIPVSIEPNKEYYYAVVAKSLGNMDIAKAYGPKLIDAMGKWVNLPYNKLGNKQAYQVAVPDFAAGAMENWGLITYREQSLLDEGNDTSSANKQKIITVMAHELSHQWFGDYVTPEWWSDIWLSEGFANYFENHLPQRIDELKEYEIEKQYITIIQEALRVDGDPSTTPLSGQQKNVNTLSEINQKFDEITYYKGGSIVRMMANVLGDNFKSGLKKYLDKFKLGHTNTHKLLSTLEQTNTTFAGFEKRMMTWIQNAGYPLVTVSLIHNKLNLTQSRFGSNDATTKWSIPINYIYSKNETVVNNFIWMEDENSTLIEFNEESWVIINDQIKGFFRVQYDDELWNRIAETLKSNDNMNRIDILNRAQLIDDIFSLARINKVAYERALAFTSYLKRETHYYPWVSAFRAFDFLLGKLSDEPNKTLRSLILDYINQAFPEEEIAYKTTSHVDILKQALILEWSCRLNKEKCIEYAKNELEIYLSENPATISKEWKLDTNSRSIIFCYGLKKSDKLEEDYDKLFKKFKESNSPQEKEAILESLGCMENKKLLNDVLNKTVNGMEIRKQDGASVFLSIMMKSAIGLDVALDFLKRNFTEVDKAYKGLNSITTIMTVIAENVKTEEQKKKVEEILNNNGKNEEITLIKNKIEKLLDMNLEWIQNNEAHIKIALDTITSSASSFAPIATISILSLISILRNIV